MKACNCTLPYEQCCGLRSDQLMPTIQFYSEPVPIMTNKEFNEKFEDILRPKKFKSTKVFDGYSTIFRQWKAEGTHCRFLHGYGISFKVTFEGELDERNWVWDFGGMKRAKTQIDGMPPKQWMDYMFDHTTIIAEDDPMLFWFKSQEEVGLIQLRIIPATGAERFAEFIFNKLNAFVREETGDRVRVTEVEFREHGKNIAIYGE